MKKGFSKLSRVVDKLLEKTTVDNKNYNKDVVEITDQELKLHKEFLKKELKKNFYWIFLISYNFLKSTLLLILTSLNPEFSNKLTNIFLSSS